MMTRWGLLRSPLTVLRYCPARSMATMIPGEPSNYLKIGIYRDPVNTATAILYYDNFSISK